MRSLTTGAWLLMASALAGGCTPHIHMRVLEPAEVAVPPYYPDTPFIRRDIAQLYDNVHEMDRQVGRWRDYLVGERAYITLSLVAKSALAWQVFGGTLAT